MEAPAGEIKPELMESVLEVSTDPCANTREAGDQLRALRAQVDGDVTAQRRDVQHERFTQARPWAIGQRVVAASGALGANVARLVEPE